MRLAESPDEKLLRGLPLPLAQLYLRTLNAKNALDRHNAAYHLWEASLKLLGSVAIVEYAAREKHDPAVSEKLKALARPSTGHWWDFVRTLVPILAQDDAGFAAVRDLVLGSKRDDLPRVAGLDAAICGFLKGTQSARAIVSVRDLFDHLVEYRNRAIGHGPAGLLSNSVYEKLSGALLAGLAELLGRLDVLAGRRLVYVEDVRRQPAGDWIIERYALAGDSPRHLESRRMSEQETSLLPKPERVYLESSGGPSAEHAETRPTLLHPLVHFDFEAEAFYFLSSRGNKKGKGAEYVSYAPGGVINRDELRYEQRELLARILEVSVDEAALVAWAEKSRADEPAELAQAPPIEAQIGEFELLSRIDQGGMGVVYRAWQPLLGRQVALKCMLGSGDPKAEARFRREIRALGRVEHPNLIKVFASGSDGDQWFYAMELVEGADLGRVCDLLAKTTASEIGLPEWDRAISTACEQARSKEKPLSSDRPLGSAEGPGASSSREPAEGPDRRASKGHVTRVVDLIRQAAEAAHALHEAKVIHRDIKPGNILVTPDGRDAVLMDLGLAQMADEAEGRLTRTRQFVGTLRYASPEQVLAAGNLDRRTDVYSLGATLWELLTLKPLFGAGEGTPTPELMRKIEHTDPEPVRKYNRNVPEDLQLIVQKCLEKDENRRYPTAKDLADDLTRWLKGDPVLAKPPSLSYLFSKFARRNRARLTAACAALVLLCAGAAAAFWQINAARLEALGQRETARNALVGEKQALGKSEQSLAALETRLRQLAFSYIDLAANNHDAGRHRVGLHWSLLAYQTLLDARSPKDDVLRQAVRRLIAGWQPAAGQSLLHDSVVAAVAFSPDGKRVVTASADATARQWDVATGRPIGAPFVHEGSVTSVAISPDSRTIVTASEDRTARLWDAATGKPLGTPMRHDEFVTFVAFSPDGRTVLTRGRDEAAWLWDAATGKPIGTPLRHAEFVTSAAFSPDGRMVVTGSRDNTAQLWDAATGKPLGDPLRHKADVLLVAFGPDGSTVLTACEDRMARLWDVTTRKPVGSPMRHEGSITAIDFSPDGRTVLTASRNQARLWEATTTEPVGNPMVHEAGVTAMAFSPDGQTIVTGSQDHTARLWDAATTKAVGEPRRHDASVTAVTFSSDGRTIATASEDHTARLWDALTEELIGERSRDLGPFQSVAFGPECPAVLNLSRHDTALLLNAAAKKSVGNPMAHGDRVWSSALFSPDGRTILKLSTATTARLWTAATRTRLGEPMQHKDAITAAAFSPDGQRIVTGSADKTARLWDAATGKPVGETMRHEGGIASVTFSPDGRTVLTRGRDDAVRLWDAATGKAVGEPMRHDDFPTTAIFSPDGRRILTLCRDLMGRFWDAATGKAIGQPIACGISYGAMFAPDGRTVLTRGGDEIVRLMDAQTLKPVGAPMRHDDRVWCMAFSPDGQTIVTGGEDRTVRRWNASTGKALGQPIRHGGSVSSVGFSPDGRTIVTGSEDKTVRLWDVATGKPVREPMRHEEFVTAAGFSPDGRTVLTVSLDLTVRMWPAPATVSDEPERIRLWVETRTGLYRDEAIELQPLSFEELLRPLDLAQQTQRHDRFDALGGPPASRAPDAEWHQSEAADGEQRGDWFAAAYHLKYLIAAEPGRVEYRLRLAKAFLNLNRYRDARLEMDEALAQEPQNVEAYQLRGRAYLGERDDEHAMADANQAMQASAPQASSVNLLGEIAAEYERWPNAAADFKRQLTFFPSVEALYSLGAVQLGAGDDLAFRETCRQLLGNDGGSAGLIDPVAAACLAIQRPSTQVDWAPYVALAQKLRDEQPEIGAGHEMLGACLLRAGRNSEAARELETALHSTRAGGNWSVNLFLAIAHAQLKNSGKAVEHLKSADQAYQSDRSPDWFDRLRFRRLRQEVDKLLAGAAAQPVRAQTASRPTAKGPSAGPPQSQPDK